MILDLSTPNVNITQVVLASCSSGSDKNSRAFSVVSTYAVNVSPSFWGTKKNTA